MAVCTEPYFFFARLNDVRVIAQKGQEEQLELEKQVKTTK
jgi:rod shape-determining protein MreC